MLNDSNGALNDHILQESQELTPTNSSNMFDDDDDDRENGPITPVHYESLADPTYDLKCGIVRDVGQNAIWSLSSCKPGFGVDQLRDDCLDTYWQSDGQLPHLVNVQFCRRLTLKDVYIYTDYKLDESYTPNKISIKVGTNFNDLVEIIALEMQEPQGWKRIPLVRADSKPVRGFMLQLAVVSNHQNGRDTHLRQIKVLSPVERKPNPMGEFSTHEMRMLTQIR